jgi:hypothetical protein
LGSDIASIYAEQGQGNQALGFCRTAAKRVDWVLVHATRRDFINDDGDLLPVPIIPRLCGCLLTPDPFHGLLTASCQTHNACTVWILWNSQYLLSFADSSRLKIELDFKEIGRRRGVVVQRILVSRSDEVHRSGELLVSRVLRLARPKLETSSSESLLHRAEYSRNLELEF